MGSAAANSMAKRVTMRDVAKQAGVSVATVSLVLNNEPGISQATRNQVKLVIDATGYTPDLQARRFSSGRTGTVGLVLPPWSAVFHDPYFVQLMQGVLEAVRDKGDQLLLEVCDQRFVDHRLWRDLFAGKRVDGLLIATPYLDQGYLQDLHDQRSPVVLINGERPDLPGLDYVGYDDFACGVDATNYLIGLGHRRIAHVAGNMNQQSACRRLEGYRHAMAAAGLAVLDDDVVYGDYLPLEGRDAARPLFERPEAERPTALFCANDTMALAIVEHQASKGLFVPRDFSVAGVDDTGAAAQATPALTTFRQDVFALSYKAADLFLQKLYSPGSPPLQHRTKMQLIERASCGRPKA